MRSLRSCRLEQEPDASLGLIDPVLQQACRRHILRFVTKRMDSEHSQYESFVLLPQLTQHVQGSDIVCIIVFYALQPGDLPDGMDRGSADLAHTLRDIVRHRKELVAVVVKQQVIVTEVWTAHMPVEVLGLDVEREDIGDEGIESPGDFTHGLRLDIGGCGE
jgi:hypothetical protein